MVPKADSFQHNTIGSLPPHTPPPKSNRCKRIALLAIATFAVLAGITAAVIFFTVSSVALSPALAITAMVVGGLGLFILGFVAIAAYKSRGKKEAIDFEALQKTRLEKKNNNVELLSFGSKAFIAPTTNLCNNLTPTTQEWNKVKARFSREFSVLNKQAGNKSVGDLVSTVYFQGTFYASMDQRYNHLAKDAKQAMGIIIEYLANDNSGTASHRQTIAQEIAEAFLSCQDEQIRVVLRVANTLSGKGLISEEIVTWWNDFKMLKLKELIYKRHRDCGRVDPIVQNQTDIQKQFVHIESAYLALLGDAFGLPGAVEAKLDKHKPSIQGSTGSITQEYRESLNLEEFAKAVAMDINNTGKEVRLEKNALMKWLMTTFPRQSHQEQFGFYLESRDYTDLATITEDHEYHATPCITLNEVIDMLKIKGIEIIS